MTVPSFDAVWINGSVGAGKTTIADQVGVELERRSVPGAVIDVDWLRRCWPSPEADPFRAELAYANIRAVATNYRNHGAQVVVAAGVIEAVSEVAAVQEALGAERMLLVRLTLDADVAQSRLRRRHVGNAGDLEWHANRHPELARILDRAGFVDEELIDVTTCSVGDVAHQIADRVTVNEV